MMRAMMGSRTGMVAVLCLAAGLYMVPAAARALEWRQLWLNDDQRGARQMEKHDYASAARTFDDKRWQAAALYRAGDYKRSAEAWSKMDDTDAHYNRGNALARSGDLKGAADEYKTVLRRDPDNVDAHHNLEVIRKLMKPSKKSSSQKRKDGKGNRDQNGKNKESRDGQHEHGGSRNQAAGENQKRNRGEEQGRSREQGRDQGDRSAASSQDEARRNQERRQDQQARSSSGKESGDRDQRRGSRQQEARKQTPEQRAAMEQWLRRIPDDPGGLLRRKFRYQYSRRRRGDEQVDQPW